MTRNIIAVMMFLSAVSLSTKLLSRTFNPLQMPKGAKVTLPQPATMKMPIDMTVQLGATDRAQALSLLALGKGAKPIRVKINDLTLNTTKIIHLFPGRPVFYNYTSLSTVRLEASSEGKNSTSRQVQIESNRPLEISH